MSLSVSLTLTPPDLVRSPIELFHNLFSSLCILLLVLSRFPRITQRLLFIYLQEFSVASESQILVSRPKTSCVITFITLLPVS